jgi:DNA-binding GntR family transcriptional regulator
VSTFPKPCLRHNRLIFDLLAAGQVEDAVEELESYLRDAERQVTAAMATKPRLAGSGRGLRA